MTTKKSKITQEANIYTIELLFFIIIAGFIISAPFYRGLFFRQDYMRYAAIIGALSLVFGIYIFFKKKAISINLFDIAIYAIPLCYFISFLFSANSKDAFDTFIKYLSYALLYFIVGQVCDDENGKGQYYFYFKELIILLTLVNAIMPILNIAEITELKGVISGSRIFGLYQYPNTTASVLAIGLILLLTSLKNSLPLWQQIYYSIATAIIFPIFIMTLSRAAILVFAIIFIALFIVNDNKNRVFLLLNTFIAALSSIVVLYGYYTLLGENKKMIFLYFSMAIAISIVLERVVFILIDKKTTVGEGKGITKYIIGLIGLIVFSIIILFSFKDHEYIVEHGKDEKESWKNKTFTMEKIEPNRDYTLRFSAMSNNENPHSYGVIIKAIDESGKSEEIYKKFAEIGEEFTDIEVKFRTLDNMDKLSILLYNYVTDSYTIYKDVKVFEENDKVIKSFYEYKYIPKAILNRFKDFKITSRSASGRIKFIKDSLIIFKHNFLIGAGGGAWNNLYRQYQSSPYNTTEVHSFYAQYADEVGILGLLALALLVFQLLYITYKAFMGKDYVRLNFYMAIWMLLMHSALDFNLSLSAPAYLLWMMFGMTSRDKNLKIVEIKNKKYISYIFIALAIIGTILPISIYKGIQTGDKAGRIGTSNIDESVKLYEKAIKLDRFNAAFRLDYSYLMMMKYIENNNDIYETEFYKNMDKVEEYEPYNDKYYQKRIQMYFTAGDIDKGIKLANEMTRLRPMLANSYVLKIDANYEVARAMLEAELYDNAIPYMKNVLEANEEFEKINENLEGKIKFPKNYDNKKEVIEEILKKINAS